MFCSKITCSLREFLRNEDGAVTVDMMPVMMMSVGVGLAVTGEVRTGTADVTNDIQSTILSAGVSGDASEWGSLAWLAARSGGPVTGGNETTEPSGGAPTEDGTDDYVFVDEDTVTVPGGDIVVAGLITIDTSIDLTSASVDDDDDDDEEAGSRGNGRAVGRGGEHPGRGNGHAHGRNR